ncbi:hypothetical protein GLOIN_2v1485037 [Rhizophagus irregularis DAOM 181602=DAOM 197198]|uniref:Uncharacterized protein n=1 Tax=Rhizophagus irregularis (strain DAOM 181602 / DAOM 197198 / MUCL 43194) TaxID=747089 RepID=A0A2P4PCA4_RHIID|nr:hypothetical protein GLOIN_2v1485037 [Rhizophagus irregularis DAOM 181602=DAOM 197198]POG62977.1 hypothetical protein GLOIN_2v1485037 [Rhizophagus irregularis DAOM 181602=DAOM 197198]|eukprot:XP_025169843.1 hypothetical protein GLOIN_2v1485037 [Rhizophagus irregularis DAOM 181602=DAOM 197198]
MIEMVGSYNCLRLDNNYVFQGYEPKEEDNISIVAVISTTTDGLSSKSTADAISEAERLFDLYFQDLVNVAKNAYESYSYFEAPEKNCNKKFIDDKKISVANKEPNLLLHNLPEQKGMFLVRAFDCITGSGLSLLRANDKISTKAKEELHVSTFNQFGRIDTSGELLELATRIFPLEEKRFAEFNLFQFLQLVS